MKILNIVSKSLTSPPITLKIFRPEISVIVEISTDFDLLTIVEFQIYSFILLILQANLGKILPKMFSNCTYRNYIQFLVFQKFRDENFLTPLTIRLVSDSVSCSASVPSYQSQIDCGTKLSSISTSVFRRSARIKQRCIVRE